MKRIRITGVIVMMLLLIVACSKDLLELDPQGQKLEANFYQTDEEVMMGVLAAYDPATWSYPWGMSWYVTLNAASDDANAGGENALDRIEYVHADEFRLTPTNPGPLNLWIKYYAGIYRTNLIMRVDLQSDLVTRAKAEARFLRAFYYFDLVRFFGDVPLVTKVLTAEEYQPGRTAKIEVYNQIIADLEAAIPNLPLKSQLTGTELGRATQGGAQALLGKVYLFLEQWQDAEDAFSDVITSGQYGLEANYADIFELDQEHGTESVIEFNYTDLRGADWGGPYGYMEGNIDIQLMGIRDLVDPDLNGYEPGWGFIKPTQDLVDVFVAEGDNERLYASVIFGDSLIARGATFNDTYGYEGYFRQKYSIKKSDSPVSSWMFSQDYMILRYADVLLMYAEALYNNNKEADAVTRINEVRTRVSLPDVNPTGTAVMDAIIKERRMELAIEGFRYWDVLRWGLADTEFGPLGYDAATEGLWPIPQEEIERTGGSLTQNDGYN